MPLRSLHRIRSNTRKQQSRLTLPAAPRAWPAQTRRLRLGAKGSLLGFQRMRSRAFRPALFIARGSLRLASTMSGPARLTVFGTAAQAPSRSRNVSATGIQWPSGTAWLVDCGEGTQHRARAAKSFRLSRLDAIFLTHLHGGETGHPAGTPCCGMGVPFGALAALVVGLEGMQWESSLQRSNRVGCVIVPPTCPSASTRALSDRPQTTCLVSRACFAPPGSSARTGRPRRRSRSAARWVRRLRQRKEGAPPRRTATAMRPMKPRWARLGASASAGCSQTGRSSWRECPPMRRLQTRTSLFAWWAWRARPPPSSLRCSCPTAS